jgi:hypothetical protein
MKNLGFVLHGTYAGSKIIKISSNLDGRKFSFPDYRGDDIKKSLGEDCYSISFKDNSIIISKFKIVFDIHKNEIGYVALSFIIPYYKKIDANSLLELLDACFEKYTSKTVNNEKEEASFRDDGEKEIYEDIERDIEGFEIETIKYHIDYSNRIKSNPAYLKYDGRKQLEKLIENPYQDSFFKYQDVFLLDKNNEKAQFTLNALKHNTSADLTSEIVFDNPDYTIEIIQTDGVQVSGIQNNSKVKLGDSVKFSFKKHRHITERSEYSGTWSQLLKDYPNIVSKSLTLPNSIEISAPNFKPEKKQIRVYFETSNNKRVPSKELDFDIISTEDNKRPSRGFIEDKIELIGHELDSKWELKVSKSEKYKQTSKTFFGSVNELSIELEKRKTINWSVYIYGIGSVLLLSALVFLGIKFWPYKEQTGITKQSNNEIKQNPVNPPNIDSVITVYLSGNELFHNMLSLYRDQVVDSAIMKKLDDAIKYRKAIDGDDRNEIQRVHDSLDLKNIPNANNILKYVLNTFKSNNFHLYKQIPNRDNIPISAFLDTLRNVWERHNIQNVTETPSTAVSNQTKSENVKTPSNQNNSFYSEKEFIEALFGNKID